MKKFTYIAVWLVVLVVIAGALLLYEGDLLWKAQQLNLFLCTSLFFHEQLVVPGGLLTWVGTFFTQFFHWPWVGVTLLCGWWLLLMALIRRTFRVPRLWSGLMLIPVGLLLLTIVDMGYWLYMLKLQGHFFVSTIGTTAVVALLWAYRCVPAKWYPHLCFGLPAFGNLRPGRIVADGRLVVAAQGACAGRHHRGCGERGRCAVTLLPIYLLPDQSG